MARFGLGHPIVFPLRRLWGRRRRLHVGADGFGTLGLSVAFLILSGGLSLAWSFWQVFATARSAPANANDGGRRVVLGGGLKDGAPSADFAVRLERARHLAAGGDILLLGGATRPELPAEAEVGRTWLLSRGVNPDKIMTECGSRDTLENLRAARDLLAPIDAQAVILITSRYHLARSSLMAEGLGIPHLLCAADDRLRYDSRTIMRMICEAFFVNWYVVGRGWATITRNQRMLARIT